MKKASFGSKIQARIVISALIIIIELLLLVQAILSFASGLLWVYTAAEIISFFTVVHIVTKRGNQSYKIMWIIFIMAIPVFGVLAYLLWGGGRVMPHLKKRMAESENKYFSYLKQSDASNSLSFNDMLHYRQAAYLKTDSGFPVYKNTKSEFFSSGEAYFGALLSELSKAQKYIFIEFFIIGEGYMWNEILQVLKEKSASGVEIKIIFDDFGSIKRQSKEFISELKSANIEVAVFNPIRPSLDVFLNNRNHRKIVIIDGKIAFTGGINIGDEYINEIARFGHWHDSAIMLEGEAVNSFIAMFCSMWEFVTHKELNIKTLIAAHEPLNEGFYIPYCDNPLNSTKPAQGIYTQIINTAQKYVYITTPYLILDSTMTAALCLAAKSEVDVRIITPAKPDKWYVHPVTQYYYSELLEAGVKIYEYTPGFIHSKLFVSDDSVATVGTVNMDYRSFNFHFECGVWCSGTKSVKQVKECFLQTAEQCSEIDLQAWDKRPLAKKALQAILHLFAPLM